MSWSTVLRWVGRLPTWAYGALGACALLLALWLGHQGAVADAYARGKRDAASGVVFDSMLVERASVRVAKAQAHTDTVVRRVTVTRTRVESLVVALPDSVRTLPPVDTLVRVVGVLVGDVDSLTSAITAERAAWTERAKVDSAALYALRVIATARGDTIMDLKQRPTRKRAALYALGAALIGFLGGKAR